MTHTKLKCCTPRQYYFNMDSKPTFFEVCGRVGKPQERQSWQDVAALQNDEYRISHYDSCSPKLSITQQIEL